MRFKEPNRRTSDPLHNPQMGFTLIELMIVITVIGILAAISLPPYMNYLNRSRVSEAFALAAPVQQAVGHFYAYTGRFPLNNQAAALLKSELITGQHVRGIEVADGAIHITLELGSDTSLLSLRPAVAVEYPPTELITWVCGYASPLEGMQVYGNDRTNVAESQLPTVCRSDFLLD